MTDTVTPPPDVRLWTAQAKARVTLPGSDEEIGVPSGQDVRLQEVILDQPSPDAAIYRFRFITPAIARDTGTMDFESSIADMQHLCDSYALQHLVAPMPADLQVIIAFSDMELPFGETNPEATQFFVAFSVTDGRCMLEPY